MIQTFFSARERFHSHFRSPQIVFSLFWGTRKIAPNTNAPHTIVTEYLQTVNVLRRYKVVNIVLERVRTSKMLIHEFIAGRRCRLRRAYADCRMTECGCNRIEHSRRIPMRNDLVAVIYHTHTCSSWPLDEQSAFAKHIPINSWINYYYTISYLCGAQEYVFFLPNARQSIGIPMEPPIFTCRLHSRRVHENIISLIPLESISTQWQFHSNNLSTPKPSEPIKTINRKHSLFYCV